MKIDVLDPEERPIWIDLLNHFSLYATSPKYIIVVIGMLFGYVFLDDYINTIEDGEKYRASQEATSNIRQAVLEAIASPVQITESVIAVVEARPELTSLEFSAIVERLLEKEPGIINVAIAPKYIVSEVYPVSGNEAVLGLDLREAFDGGRAVGRAVESSEIVVAGPARSIQGPDVFITRGAIYNRGTGELWGIASVVYSLEEFRKTFNAEEFGDMLFSLTKIDGDRHTLVLGTDITESDAIVTSSFHSAGSLWEIKLDGDSSPLAEISFNRLPFTVVFTIASVLVLYYMVASDRQRERREDAEMILIDALNTLDEGFVIYDKDDRFVTCNEAYKSIYSISEELLRPGIKFEQIIRHGVMHGQYPEAVGREEEWIAKRMKEHAEAATTLQQHDGRWLKISERKTIGGMTVGFRVDITETKFAQEAAEKASQVKSEFISVLSHELRTPLTVILGYAKVLESIHILETVKKFEESFAEVSCHNASAILRFNQIIDQTRGQARKIVRSGEHLLVLINDLLDYSKIEAGKLELKCRVFSLDRMICDLLEDMDDIAAKKEVKLRHDVNDVRVFADPIRMKQVLINLLQNAIKFTDNGEVLITAKTQEGHTYINVRDTGCGISQEDRSLIFEAFRQVDLSDRRRAGGTGLGLAITRRIVEAHNGAINVTSELGVGTCFEITLPNRSDLYVD